MTLKAEEKKGVLVLLGIGTFVALVLGVYVWVKVNQPIIGADNCVYEDKLLVRRVAADHAVIIVDQSEEFSESHKRQVKDLLLDFIADEKQFGLRSRFMLYVFGKNDFQPGGAGQDLKPSLSLCKPPSSGNVVIENKRKIEKGFRDRFLLPLYGTIDTSLEVALGERSPILEMIQYISRTQDIRDVLGDRSKRTLIVVSDLLQHSANLSHYKDKGANYEDFLGLKTLNVDLRGWTIRVLYLQRYAGRDQKIQEKNHLEFWQRYFRDAGAKIDRIDKVP